MTSESSKLTPIPGFDYKPVSECTLSREELFKMHCRDSATETTPSYYTQQQIPSLVSAAPIEVPIGVPQLFADKMGLKTGMKVRTSTGKEYVVKVMENSHTIPMTMESPSFIHQDFHKFGDDS